MAASPVRGDGHRPRRAVRLWRPPGPPAPGRDRAVHHPHPEHRGGEPTRHRGPRLVLWAEPVGEALRRQGPRERRRRPLPPVHTDPPPRGPSSRALPVDADGLVVDGLAATSVDRRRRHARPPVSPRHRRSPERRTRLVGWARRREAWIIEDDYDGEFRYDRRPVGALQGLAPDRVVYAGPRASRSAPASRGWLVLPAALHVDGGKRGRDSDVSQLEQAASPTSSPRRLDRHVRRIRAIYRKTPRPPPPRGVSRAIDHPDVPGVSAGLHLTVALPVGTDTPPIVRRAFAEHGLALWGLLRQHYQGGATTDGLVLGFELTSVRPDDSIAAWAGLASTSATTAPRPPRPRPRSPVPDLDRRVGHDESAGRDELPPAHVHRLPTSPRPTVSAGSPLTSLNGVNRTDRLYVFVEELRAVAPQWREREVVRGAVRGQRPDDRARSVGAAAGGNPDLRHARSSWRVCDRCPAHAAALEPVSGRGGGRRNGVGGRHGDAVHARRPNGTPEDPGRAG